MAANPSAHRLAAGWMENSGRGPLYPLDESFDYLMRRGGRVLPLYLIAMAPFSAVVLFLIDAVSSERRSVLPWWCFLLTLAAPWRWVWIALAQLRVREDVTGSRLPSFRGGVLRLVALRSAAAFAQTWGAFLLAPPFVGFFLGGFAVPIIAETRGGLWAQARAGCRRIFGASRRLGGVSAALAAGLLALAACVFVAQLLLVQLILPSFLGLKTADLSATLGSPAWMMSLAYGILAAMDFYWTVASVMVFYDLQARRLGSDLHRRLEALQGGTR